MNYINQHSFTLSALIIYLFVTILLVRDGIRISDIIALADIAGVLILSWIILRPGPSTLTRLDDFQEALTSTEPTLIEFQSEY